MVGARRLTRRQAAMSSPRRLTQAPHSFGLCGARGLSRRRQERFLSVAPEPRRPTVVLQSPLRTDLDLKVRCRHGKCTVERASSLEGTDQLIGFVLTDSGQRKVKPGRIE